MAKKRINKWGSSGKVENVEVEERDRGGNSSGDAHTEEETARALEAMVKKEKPKVSDEEPKDKNSIQYLAWKRRQKNLGRSMGL